MRLGRLWTVRGRVCVEDLDHGSGGGERLCYRWKTPVPGGQTVEGQHPLSLCQKEGEQHTRLPTFSDSSRIWPFY